jgi:uncharacterized protein YjiS (DUF1127 family)
MRKMRRMTYQHGFSGQPSRRRRFALAQRFWRLSLALGVALKVRRERRMLLALDDRVLKDIGFDRGTAHGEAQRPFWDVPVDRLRR